jgi:cytochrome c-type biogenesis protein CcmH
MTRDSARTLRWTAILVALAIPISASGADLEREAREIEESLIAPCCFSQQVSVHQSAAAGEVRQDIRRRLRAGQTRAQITDAYVERYGKRILAQPPAEGFDRLLYILPPFALVLTAALVVIVVRRFTAHVSRVPAEGVAGAPAGAEDSYQADLDAELRDLD